MKVIEQTGRPDAKCSMMYWETSPKLRGKAGQPKDKEGNLTGKPYNIINLYLKTGIEINVGDKIVSSGTETLSCYTVEEVVSSVAGSLSSFNFWELKISWKREMQSALPNREDWIN